MSTTYHPNTDVLDELQQAVRKVGPLIREHAPAPAVIYAKNPLERHFRDALDTAAPWIHVGESFRGRRQVYCGVQPEFAMVAF